MLLSLLSDIISFFLTGHLRIGYELTRLVYWAAGVKLGGGLLWGVFRGNPYFLLGWNLRNPFFSKEKDTMSSATARTHGPMISINSCLAQSYSPCWFFFFQPHWCIMFFLRG